MLSASLISYFPCGWSGDCRLGHTVSSAQLHHPNLCQIKYVRTILGMQFSSICFSEQCCLHLYKIFVHVAAVLQIAGWETRYPQPECITRISARSSVQSHAYPDYPSRHISCLHLSQVIIRKEREFQKSDEGRRDRKNAPSLWPHASEREEQRKKKDAMSWRRSPVG